MAVFFKLWKGKVKLYKNLCPNKFVYLKKGKYILNLKYSTLTCLDDQDQDQIDMSKIDPFPFYKALDVDPERDCRIQLKLNKDGIFVREDDVNASSNIETLFSSTRKG